MGSLTSWVVCPSRRGTRPCQLPRLTSADLDTSEAESLSSTTCYFLRMTLLRPWRPVLAIFLAAVLLLTACGKGDVGRKAEATDDGTTTAAEVCNEALTKQQAGVSDDAIVARDKTLADKAAKAAVTNAKWKDLAKAISDWALTGQDLVEMTKRLQTMSDAEFMTEMAQVSARVGDARRGVIAACRYVKASGGKVDDSLLNSI